MHSTSRNSPARAPDGIETSRIAQVRQFELTERVLAYDPKADIGLVDAAYVMAVKAHGDQQRDNGDPYITHPLAVADILASYRLDTGSIVTALLHDVVEDTGVKLRDIEQRFGPAVAGLVDGVTKLTKLELKATRDKQAENFRKLVLAMSQDIRVLLVKLADRLHNMRTLHFVESAERRQRIARETMEIYAPLAERIGMDAIKTELQNLAFAQLEGEASATIHARLNFLRGQGADIIEEVRAELARVCLDAGVEFVEVVKGLWDSWEGDALVRDKASGVFFDPAKLHALNHVGKHFKVQGPLSVARTPQGRPLLVQAGASEQGLEIAAASADVVYSAAQDLGSAQAYYATLKGRLAKHGRESGDLLVMPGITPFIGRTMQEAQDRYEQLNALVDPRLGLSYLYGQMGDLSDYDVDGPVPEPNDPKVRSIAKGLVAMAHRDGLTIRQLYTRIAAGFGTRVLIGTAQSIADDMQHWMEASGADGFNICPPALPIGLDEFAATVIPELQRRGLFRREYEAATLRGNLGLREPANRYSAAA